MADTGTEKRSIQTRAGDIVALANRAQKGDKSALPAIREVLDDPAMVDLLGGDLAKQAQLTLIEKFSTSNLLLRESLPRKLDNLRRELGGPAPTALEKLVVDRIVACWLHLHHLEHVYAQKDSMSLELGTYYEKSIGQAQRRYLAAIRCLALIRRLAIPALQVNIARKQQVNNCPREKSPQGDSVPERGA